LLARLALLAALAACLIALAACGGDDEDQAATTPETAPATTEQETATAETETEAPETETAEPQPPVTETEPPATTTSPEDQPGGAGDEEPVHSLAQFTGRGGAITPRLVRVPAFIAIRVEVRSADGERYGLRCGDEKIEAGGALGSVSTTIDGLRPGDSITCTPTGGGNVVRIAATAEPGP
jgi:hypothetical protein